MQGLNLELLPTPLAQSVARAIRCDIADRSERFNCLQYLTEAYFKYHVLVAHSLISDLAPRTWHYVGHNLARASSLGTWDAELTRIERAVLVSKEPTEARRLIEWQKERRRGKRAEECKWYDEAEDVAHDMWAATGFEHLEHAKTVRGLLSFLVAFRNKTRGHGAYPRTFYDRVNGRYASLLEILLRESASLELQLLHVSEAVEERSSRTYLSGLLPTRSEAVDPGELGLRLASRDYSQSTEFSSLLRYDEADSQFYFANGGWQDSSNSYEALNYYTGATRHVTEARFALPPVAVPASHTAGRSMLAQGANSAHNMPDPPAAYIARQGLQDRLRELLLDRVHRIVTLHGMGGAGKTTLAREVVLDLATRPQDSERKFDLIVWFSARDIDLLVEGPQPRLRDVKDLTSIAEYFCRLLGEELRGEDALETFSEYVSQPDASVLLIMDNFETLDNPVEVHEALDQIVVLPSKVLITSRLRAFKGDFPVEVRGMEFEEATQLLQRESRRVGCEALMNSAAISQIYEYTSGIPYAMKLVTSQLRRGRPLRQIVDDTITSERIVEALFSREFEALGADAKQLFLTVGKVGNDVPLIAVQAVFAVEKLNFFQALEDCERASLVELHDVLATTLIGMPEVAKKFARIQLISSEDRIAVERLTKWLRAIYHFDTSVDPVMAFARKIIAEQRRDRSGEARSELSGILEALAEGNPSAWQVIADARKADGETPDRVRVAYQRAVEAAPNDRGLWESWADYELAASDAPGRYKPRAVELRVRAAECDPTDAEFSGLVAGEVSALFAQEKSRYPLGKRYEWVAGLIANLDSRFEELSPDVLSRLGWLHFFVEQHGDAVKCVRRALELDPGHRYSRDLEKRLG